MEIIEMMGRHRVYDSARKVLSLAWEGSTLTSINPDYSNSAILHISPKNYVHYTRIGLSKSRFYAMRTPLISLGTWEALLRGVPMCIIEEYSERKTPKDTAAKLLLSPFKKIPFISSTKRTRAFLTSAGMESFLIPPAHKRGEGGSRRKHILYVGKLHQSKNPFFFLGIAKAFPQEKFIMLGQGSLSAQVKEAASKLNNVEVIPFLEKREDLFKYYSGAKLLIHPAIQDPIAFVIIEALSMQVPVLSSFGAGASDFLPEEWVADPRVLEEFVEKTKSILASGQESIRKAQEVFSREHLDIEDAYFGDVARKLSLSVIKRWPALFPEE